MIFRTTGSLIGLAFGFLMPMARAQTCLMIYQMADNNLEYYIRQDYEELTNSPLMQTGQVRLWVYYDALNQGGDPLPNTVDQNGNALTTTDTGSHYVTWDPSISKMRVVQELAGEQNSDTPEVMEAFLITALKDCLANGFTSLMAVFSSHGGGFAGYGGDENAARKLLQTNQGLVTAISNSLASAGAPAQLDVLGFDACLMQALEAADDYKAVTKYLLASEAVEPGHGWAYAYLQSAPTALDLAGQVLDSFINEMQGSVHQNPKTMAILDTTKFATFVTSLETFAKDILAALQAGDVSLYTFISRARSSAVAFESVVDVAGSETPSGLDIGSFLQEFTVLCNPTGTIGTDLATAIQNYNGMFVKAAKGDGTAAGTGMHITWPDQEEYLLEQDLWDQVLFGNSAYVTEIIPNFRAFLQWFLPATTPTGDGASSVCSGNGVAPAQVSAPTDQLIISDSGQVKDGFFDITAEINSDVTKMLVEYGLDLSTPLKPVLVEKGYTPTDDEYLYLLGGDVAGVYKDATYTAKWDQNFYFLNITGTKTFEALYVFDEGGGSKKIPTMYFPKEKEAELGKLQFLDFLFFDFKYWVSQGAQFSFLKFSVDEAQGRINKNLALFTGSNGVFSEQPRTAGGFLIPLIYIDAFIQGKKLTTLPGGFNQTVIKWAQDLDYNVLTTPASRIFEVIKDADAVVINMYAHANGVETPETRYYDVIRPDKSGPEFTLADASATNGAGSSTPIAQGQPAAESVSSNSAHRSVMFAVSVALVGLLIGAF